MNLLIDPLPYEVEIDGETYEIRTDFRISMMFDLMMHDPDLDNDEKIITGLNLYYHEIPDNIVEAVIKILWFFSGGKNDHEKAIRNAVHDAEESGSEDSDGKEGGDEREEMCFSFEYDAEYIYAAFLQQYGIDLTETDMHWWKFKALFASLVEPCKFSTIVGYRTAKIPSTASSEQKAHLRKMKRIFALPMSEKEQSYQDNLLEALKNGGNVDAVLRGEGG